MSHMATTTFDICTKDEQAALKQLSTSVINLKEVANKNGFSKQFNLVIAQLEQDIAKANQEIAEIGGPHTISGDSYTLSRNAQKLKESYYLNLDNIIKRVENLWFSLNITDELSDLLNSEDVSYANWIAEHGYVAKEAINNLIINNLVVNDENFNQAIKKIREQAFNVEHAQATLDLIKHNINQSNIPDEFKQNLYAQLLNIHTNLEVMDYTTLLKSIEINTLKTTLLINDSIGQLKKMDFKVLSKKAVILKSDDADVGDVYKISLKAVNRKNNTIVINFGLDGTIDYKLGNYVGHLCDADGDKFTKGLVALGRKIVANKITRTSSMRPQPTTVKMKEGAK